MKIGVLLSGCGVYDGSEIHESVLTLLAIEEEGYEPVCISIDKNQHHVINHIDGSELNQERNMLQESARIARGNIKDISEIDPSKIDALVIPGGFGNAKNFTKWAFDGSNGEILPEVKLLLVNLVNVGKPIVALCVSPIILAKAFENSSIHPSLTIGSNEGKSPYDILDFSLAMESLGTKTEMKTVSQILIDEKNKIISAPCYMMDASIVEIRNNISQAIKALKQIV
jgi:enhancing lycopene biosynthesis protein 2